MRDSVEVLLDVGSLRFGWDEAMPLDRMYGRGWSLSNYFLDYVSVDM